MDDVKIYLDENLPSLLADGLNKLTQPLHQRQGIKIEISSIAQEFGKGTADEEWIPQFGKIGGIVLTQDFNIQRIKAQRELYIQHKIGLLIIRPPSKSGLSYWEMVKLLVKNCEDIVKFLKKSSVPFAATISVRGKIDYII